MLLKNVTLSEFSHTVLHSKPQSAAVRRKPVYKNIQRPHSAMPYQPAAGKLLDRN